MAYGGPGRSCGGTGRGSEWTAFPVSGRPPARCPPGGPAPWPLVPDVPERRSPRGPGHLPGGSGIPGRDPSQRVPAGGGPERGRAGVCGAWACPHARVRDAGTWGNYVPGRGRHPAGLVPAVFVPGARPAAPAPGVSSAGRLSHVRAAALARSEDRARGAGWGDGARPRVTPCVRSRVTACDHVRPHTTARDRVRPRKTTYDRARPRVTPRDPALTGWRFPHPPAAGGRPRRTTEARLWDEPSGKPTTSGRESVPVREPERRGGGAPGSSAPAAPWVPRLPPTGGGGLRSRSSAHSARRRVPAAPGAVVAAQPASWDRAGVPSGDGPGLRGPRRLQVGKPGSLARAGLPGTAWRCGRSPRRAGQVGAGKPGAARSRIPPRVWVAPRCGPGSPVSCRGWSAPLLCPRPGELGVLGARLGLSARVAAVRAAGSPCSTPHAGSPPGFALPLSSPGRLGTGSRKRADIAPRSRPGPADSSRHRDSLGPLLLGENCFGCPQSTLSLFVSLF